MSFLLSKEFLCCHIDRNVIIHEVKCTIENLSLLYFSGNPSPNFGNSGHACPPGISDSGDGVGRLSAGRQRRGKHGVSVWYH